MKKNLLSILLTGMLVAVGGSTALAQLVFLVQEPANLSGSINFTNSFTADAWGADLDTVAMTAQAAFAYDGTANDSLVCEDVVNRSEIEGKVAFIYRGECNFSDKALNAQDSGAVAVVIINHSPGALVNMLGGTVGAQVHIPVLFISDADGAALHDSIAAGAVTVFIGNPAGVFANNVGAYKPHAAMANSFAVPSPFALTDTDFNVPIGCWVHNYGSAAATEVTVNAVIDRDGTEVYNETTSGSDIPIGDSLFFALTLFSENGYVPGFYTITYALASDSTDEFPIDNEVTAGFWINDEGTYSKSRVDPDTGPLGSGGVRPANGTEYQWCTFMQSENASAMEITGVTFATVTNNSLDLTGQAVQLAVYEWNDPIQDVTFDDLNEATDNEFYDYPSDLQSEFVTHTFAQPVELLDDQKYLTCVTIFVDDMFLTVDGGLDYSTNYETYPGEVFFPLNDIDGGSWFAGGFGTDNTPAIITELALVNGIAEDINAHDVTPYPNPTVDMIQIPFGTTLVGTVDMQVYDVTGRSVMSEELCLKNAQELRVDVSTLSSGIHTFGLTFEDGSHASFRVVISK